MPVTADDIADLRRDSPDYAETEQLKAEIEQLRQTRDPFHLTAAELDKIFRWKLVQQYERGRARRDSNTNEACRVVTEAAFRVHVDDIDLEAEIRLGILTSLRGVGVPVASAILALTDPADYCVIDFRGWRAVFNEDKHSFSVPEYRRYRNQVAELADELSWPVQEVDLAIWCYDRRKPKNCSSV